MKLVLNKKMLLQQSINSWLFSTLKLESILPTTKISVVSARNLFFLFLKQSAISISKLAFFWSNQQLETSCQSELVSDSIRNICVFLDYNMYTLNKH